ncbi:MAG: hypothetical protein JO218_18615 [Burkholderiales bacterium]|nr:hypothetical protein [Burkholderiales bacterium]
MTTIQHVILYREAPPKPAFGAPCNGCGVCCAAEPCPVGRRLFRVEAGACPALVWLADEGRYACGVLRDPHSYLRFLPRSAEGLARRWIARRIAAGAGCDSDASVEMN